MRKVLIGVLVVALGVVGGYFGVSTWARMRAERELDAAFDSMRAAGATATHGPVAVNLIKRTLVIDDVVLQSGTPPVNLRAPRIEIAGIPINSIQIRKPEKASTVEALRAVLAEVDVGSITVPTLTIAGKSVIPATAGKSAGDIDLNYAITGLVLRDVRDRRIGSLTIDRTAFAMLSPTPDVSGFNGEMNKWSASDIDLDTVLAMFDPAAADKPGPFRRAYGPMNAGVTKIDLDKGGHLQIDAITADGFDVEPSKYNIGRLLVMLDLAQKAGPTPTPVQTAQLLERIAGIYEGIRLGRAEARGISFGAPAAQQGGEAKIASLRMTGFENGRLGELLVEGVDLRVPQQEPIVLGRFSMTGLNFVNMMRLGGQAIAMVTKPGTALGSAALPLIEGIAFETLKVPIKQARQPVVVDKFDFNWSQFLGPVPTKAALKLKFSSPLAGNNDGLKLLAAEGITSVSVDFDIGAGWTEAAKTFAVTPLAMNVADWFSANATASVGNVSRDFFTIDMNYATKVVLLALGVEAGPIEFVLRDTGALDRLLATFAKQQGISVRDARELALVGLGAFTAPIAADHPELMPIIVAVKQFVEAPRGTLTLKIVPNGHVPVVQVVTAGQTDPFAALALFKIEATTTR